MFEFSFVSHFGFSRALNFCISLFVVLGGLCSGYVSGFCLGNFCYVSYVVQHILYF